MNFIKKLVLQLSGALLRDGGSKVLFYHDIFGDTQYTAMGTPLPLFQRHLETIGRNGFTVVSKIDNDKREVQICLDDGFKGIWDCRSLWDNLPWRPTVFLAVELLGQEGYLDREQITELARDGFIFQSHGWSHLPLTEFTGDLLVKETAGSKRWLEELLGYEVTEICFPIGNFSKAVLDACRDAGYRRMYSSIPGNCSSQVFPNVVRRNLVQSYDGDELKAVLHGGLAPFASRYFRMHSQK